MLGDPRFPIALDDWRTELAQRNERFGQPQGYWCYVPGGTYQIGGWKEGEPSADLPLAPFWIARFPITVAQYAPFLDMGYAPEAERWWTPNGWQWKAQQKRSTPYIWGTPPHNGPNQPVIGVAWYEAMAFCAWLTDQLADVLPPLHEIRLPTEAEWEAAAAYDLEMQRRPYPWGIEEPTPDQAIYAVDTERPLNRSAPVGCCPAGAAACSTLDMAGNVWEWCTSSAESYPMVSADVNKDFTTNNFDVPLLGGAYNFDSTYVRCGARNRDNPDGVYYFIGFRVIAAPRRAPSS